MPQGQPQPKGACHRGPRTRARVSLKYSMGLMCQTINMPLNSHQLSINWASTTHHCATQSHLPVSFWTRSSSHRQYQEHCTPHPSKSAFGSPSRSTPERVWVRIIVMDRRGLAIPDLLFLPLLFGYVVIDKGPYYRSPRHLCPCLILHCGLGGLLLGSSRISCGSTRLIRLRS